MEPILSHTFNFANLKPFSVNASYVRTFSGVTKSSGAHEFSAQIFNVISRESEAAKLEELRNLFDEAKHAWCLTIIAHYPEAEFYTKKGTISSKTIDLSNAEKLIIDCLFLPKFHNLPFPQGAQNLNSDDRHIVDMISKKRPAKDRLIQVSISIVDRVAYLS